MSGIFIHNYSSILPCHESTTLIPLYLAIRDAERRRLNVVREVVEPAPQHRTVPSHNRGKDALVRVEQDFRELLRLEHLLEDHACVQRDLLVLVPSASAANTTSCLPMMYYSTVVPIW